MNKKTIEAREIEFYYIEHDGWMSHMRQTRKQTEAEFDEYMRKFPDRKSAKFCRATFRLEAIEVLKP